MKQKLLLSLFALLTAMTARADVTVNATNFPDEGFRNWIKSQPYGADSLLTDAEIAGVTELKLYSNYFHSLKGIEFFTALTNLQCQNSYNLNELDMSKNTALTNLSCYSCEMTSLNVSGCSALTALSCSYNKLTSLDVSGCPSLTSLSFCRNQIKGAAMDALIAGLPTVNGSTMIAIDYQNEGNVMTKSQVAAAKAKGWTPLFMDPNYGWREYEGSEDPEPAAGLEINASNFPDENFRSWLLEQEYGTDGVLTDEEIADIQSITIYSRGIHNLRGIEFFTALTALDCSFNELDSLDVSGCPGLTSLICQLCGLTTLDVSKNTALDRLICTGNRLTSLDVSNHSALNILTCDNNLLATLNVSGCTNLGVLSFTSNRIKGAGMDAFVESLPMGGPGWMYVIGSSPDEQNVMTTSQVITAKIKGWIPARWAGYTETGWDIWEDYPGIDEDSIPSTSVAIDATNFPDAYFRQFLLGQAYGADSVLTAEEIEAVTYLRITNTNARSFQGIEFFTALKELNCWQNQLTTLDLSKNTALTKVWCFNNKITSLNVSGCTALQELDCNDNQLQRLNVSGCPALTNLYFYKNQIKDSQMDSLIMSLPVVSDGIMDVIDPSSSVDQNGMTKSQVAAAKAKGWTPKYWSGNGWLEYEGSEDPVVVTDFATLTYAAAGQSTTKMTVKKGTVTLSIAAEENWAIDSLTVNGQSRLDSLSNSQLTINMQADTEVRVAFRWANLETLYFEDYATGIATIGGENVKVFVIDHQLCIEGAAGRPVRLYTVSGALIKTITPQDSEKVGVFSLPAGIYIVQVGNKAAKISVR